MLTLVQHFTPLAALALLYLDKAFSPTVKITVFGKDSVNDGVVGEWVSNAIKQKVDFAVF